MVISCLGIGRKSIDRKSAWQYLRTDGSDGRSRISRVLSAVDEQSTQEPVAIMIFERGNAALVVSADEQTLRDAGFEAWRQAQTPNSVFVRVEED